MYYVHLREKQYLFPYTALTLWFLQQIWTMFTERYGQNEWGCRYLDSPTNKQCYSSDGWSPDIHRGVPASVQVQSTCVSLWRNWHVLVLVISFSPLSNIPSTLHFHLHLFVAFTWGINGRCRGALQTTGLFLKITVRVQVFSLVDKNMFKKLRGITRVRLCYLWHH